MPNRAFNSVTHRYPMPARGINLYVSKNEMNPAEALLTQNCIYRNGIIKRNGYEKRTETNEMTAVTSSKSIVGLHRFYYGSSSKHTVAVSGTNVRYWDGSAWQNINTGRTADKRTLINTWGPLNKCYIANATDAALNWDGTTATSMSGAGFQNVPGKPIQFLPYQDRLLVLDENNPGDLVWSHSYSDTNYHTIAECGVRPDVKLHGMIIHSGNDRSFGVNASVLIAGTSDMYLFQGTDLSPLSTSYNLAPLGLNVGCSAVRTMINTIKGSIWLGNDRQVYMLPHGAHRPVRIGDKILSNDSDIEGLEKIPAGQIENACAAYDNDIYILSVAPNGQTTNTKQWWLDVRRLAQDENGFWGPWFGPMTGSTISVFASQDGAGDAGELLAGDQATTSQIYEFNKRLVYSDNGASIPVLYQTFYNPLGNEEVSKVINRMEFDAWDSSGAVRITFWDYGGRVLGTSDFSLGSNAVYWNDKNWNEFNWSAGGPVRSEVRVSPPARVRRLSIVLRHDISNDRLEVYGIKVKAEEQSLVFEANT